MEEHTHTFCTRSSLANGENLWGTAPNIRVWLLLEYRHPWGARTVEDNQLPGAVNAHLQQSISGIGSARLLFIKQPQRVERRQKFFIAVATANRPKIFEFSLNRYEELLNIDITGIAFGNTDDIQRQEPLFAVCTNGKRDRCCAKFGVAAYEALASYAGEAVWQCTHIGGHRFAPTLIAFPQGIVYGRVNPDDARQIYHATRLNYAMPKYLRGRSCYPPPTQAAEYALMNRSKNFSLDAFNLSGFRTLENGTFEVSFGDALDGQHTVCVQERKVLPAILSDCDAGNPKTITQYDLIEYR